MAIQDKRILRARVLQAIREYFYNEGFLETDTPSFVFSPGMEPHIRPIQVQLPGQNGDQRVFLPTSPEFAMKRLLSQGYENIFQICKAYRLEPKSSTHNPEFTILEWYRGHSGFEAIMNDVERLFAYIEHRVFEKPNQLQKPWPRFTVEECFRKFAGLELTELFDVKKILEVCVDRGWISQAAEWDDLFFLVMMNAVEPALAKFDTPVIVYHYPQSQAALSNLFTDERGFRWAKRFEVYAGGFELGNAFDELSDANEQRNRFVKDMALRKRLYGDEFPPNPIDEDFLEALKIMPPSGGIAMGVDRIVMYFTQAQNITDVLWGESYWPT